MATKPAAKPKQQPQQQAKPPAPAKQAGGALAVPGADALILVGDKQDLSHLQTGQARGNENVSTEDLVIPRLEVVQSQSKCLVTGTPEFIEGAKQGDLINSVTRQVYGREAFLIPVHYTKQWLVWKEYDQGGGFFGAFGSPEEAKERLEEVVAAGEAKREHLEVIDTPQHLCLLVDVNTRQLSEVMLPLAKTKAKVSRAWNTMIRLTGQDRFARVYRVQTAQETNKKNQTFWNYAVSQAGAPAPALFKKAQELFESIAKGRTYTMDTKGYDEPGQSTGEDAEM